MKYTVYVLYSVRFRKTYTGFTSDFTARLKSHNELSTKGFTVRYRPWEVLHAEVFEEKSLALGRERELKTGQGREFIKRLIDQRYG